VSAIAGATLTGDGSVMLILNPSELIKDSRSQITTAARTVVKATRTLQKPLDVLVVDDSLSVRTIVSNLVKQAGWNPIQARDGLEALQQIQSTNQRPDVILLDVEMPRMDGYELTASLRAERAYKDIPIVMLTSRAGEKHRRKALDLGVNEYLVKPYNDEQLLSVIRQLVFAS
jgi:chemosensory pili system protein ChpA (sensor histidine kinase/response regulator)